MSDIAIRVENLGKKYRIGGKQERYKRFTETAMDALTAPLRRLRRLGKPAPDDETIWALRDVSFEIERGEAVGIIGRNGAGKSTLLKILSRITDPTIGQAELHGRVASLLEVGTGFHPELTGRENIYLNGSILGMHRGEIDRKFDEIVAFAEIESFLDTPVKRYSSGMYVRLAFAVAAHMDPEIMVVDEVLAVGDAQFQKKCLGKMGEVARGGRTVLFVSHNMGAIKSICDRAICLKNGRLVSDGPVDEVVAAYLDEGLELVPFRDTAHLPRERGSGAAKIQSVSLERNDGSPSCSFSMQEPFRITFRVTCLERLPLSIWLFLRDSRGEVILSSFEYDANGGVAQVAGELDFSAFVCVNPNLLRPGVYSITAGIFGSGREFLDWVDHASALEILPRFVDGRLFDGRLGYVSHPYSWRRRVSSPPHPLEKNSPRC